MNAKDLRFALTEIEEIFAAAGQKQLQQDFNDLRHVLEEYDEQDLNAFLEDVRNSVSKGEGVVPPICPDDRLIGQYLDQLLAAGTDSAAFEAAMKDISANAALRKLELQAIANRYVAGRRRISTKDSKAKLLEIIRAHFNELVYEQKSRDRARRATPW